MTTTSSLIPYEMTLDPVRPLRFGTLVDVELRKATDTRGGRGLLLTIVAVSLVVLGWKVAHPNDAAQSFPGYAQGVATVVTFLAPIAGVLAMTSEWTQRTVLTTLTLAPRRASVFAAKATASIALALGALAVVLALGAGALALSSLLHGSVEWGSPLTDVRGAVIMVVVSMLMGLAFGALAGNTPIGMGAYLLAPTVWSAAGYEVFGDSASWLDVFWAFDRLSSPDPFRHLGETVTAVSLWVVVPAVLGTIRWLRREVS